jgi:hypothetical protein
MSVRDDDYRLEHHKAYLQGAVLRWSSYKQPSPAWDHDYCEFCWQRLPSQHPTTRMRNILDTAQAMEGANGGFATSAQTT